MLFTGLDLYCALNITL